MTQIISKASAQIPIDGVEFTMTVFTEGDSPEEHLAVRYGDLSAAEAPLVRVHSECLTGDVFGSQKCDCGWQLKKALEEVRKAGSGMVIYLRQEGRGIGLIEKLKAYKFQEQGYDTVEANTKLGHGPDLRRYDVAVEILKYFNVSKVSLLTNNPEKIEDLEKHGIQCTRVPIVPVPGDSNIDYLLIKQQKMRHLFNFSEGGLELA